MKFQSTVLRIGEGKNFHLRRQDGILEIYYTSNNCSKKVTADLDGKNLIRLGITAYCDEVIKMNCGTLYRIRNNLMIKQENL